jgi:UDP-GlcNAc3NAcA epimerase
MQSRPLKVMTIIGARPQFIKASAVSAAFKASGQMQEIVVNTGQHYDDNMSQIFFSELGMDPPAFNLNIGSGQHGAQTGAMMTNSTLAGALVGAKLHVPVAHVEAGLRSFNRLMPEEINRIVSDHVSELLFAPTIVAVDHLANEGISGEKVIQSGDVMYDVALAAKDRIGDPTALLTELRVEAERFVLATVHRAENTDSPDRLRAIIEGLVKVARTIPVVLPLHPRTRKLLADSGLEAKLESSVKVIDPVGYYDMVRLESSAAVVATDSGGVQKEAYFYGVPCVTLRTETEWVELVDLGWNRIVPPVDSDQIRTQVIEAIGTKGEDQKPYGDGSAASIIVDALVQHSLVS